MSKLAEAIQAETRGRGPKCSIPAFRASLPKDIRADFDNAVASDAASTTIARACSALGYKLTEFPLQRHRRNDCSCGRAS